MTGTSETEKETIAILGGTGKEGKGLAYRWALAGYPVIIGSRTREKAIAAIEEIKTLLGSKESCLKGLSNDDALKEGSIFVLTVPFEVHKNMLNQIKPFVKGKILIDVTVPLVPPRVTTVQMPLAGSAAMEALEVLGDEVDVVTAFQNISYEKLITGEILDCDVLVCGKSKYGRQKTLELVKAAGMEGFDAGPLENSIVVEGLTSILIGINKQFGVKSAGLRITGIPRG